jgi:two-component system cell cycle sensor histidine kinase/response regulator CckA
VTGTVVDARDQDGVYLALFQRSTMPLWVVEDETRRFLAVNDAAVEMYGWSRDEFLTMRVEDLLSSDERLRNRYDYHPYLPKRGQGVEVLGQFRHRRKDGTRIDVRIEATRVDFSGRAALLSTVIDETGRRKLEERLHEADRLWRALVETSPDVVLIVAPDGTVLFVNRARTPFVGTVIVGRKIWEFAAEGGEARLSAVLRKLVETREAFRYEGPGPTIPGEATRYYEVSAIPLVIDGAVDRIIWIAADVSARRSLEAQLRQSQKLEAIGLLAGGVAHDFNNLLGIIMGFSEASVRKLPPGHPVAEQLEEVISAARRGGELTRKLLAFSRKQVMQPTAIDLHAVVGSLTKLVHRVLGEDVDLRIERESDPLVVRADSVQLEQVLLNLCTNARQAMPDGGRLTLRVSRATLDAAFARQNPWSRGGRFAEITVSDTGIGMDEATRARLFEPFFTTKVDGTGLGLATAYGIVQQHGGFMGVETVPGEGSTFRVFLPLLDMSAEAHSTPSVTPRDEKRGRELVLVAEDDRSLRSLVSGTLRELGYAVIEAADGDEAVRRYGDQASEIALVVLDVVLPRLDARQVYERIRELRPDVKVLLTTGYAPESTRLGALIRERGLALLQKPFMPSELAARVRSVLDGGGSSPSTAAPGA